MDAALLAERGRVTPGSEDHETAVDLLEMQAVMARQRAAQILLLNRLWVEPSGAGSPDEQVENDLAASIALRTTIGHAAAMLRDAHQAVTDFPQVFTRLRRGHMPAEWFDRMLRTTRWLTPQQRHQIDDRISTWQLTDIPPERFRRELRYLTAWFHQAEPEQQTVEDRRGVALIPPADADGTACIQITGPIPEITALWHRLDACTRAVQDQQRRALEDGSRVPFDLDGAATTTRTPLSLDALRYAVMTRSVLDTGGIDVPTDRFRINVVVPVLTLMGHHDAPALLDGTTPIPADMARRLAAEEPIWHRVLTDPISGAFLPVAATTYRPTTAMLEHLRLRNPVCAAPGCTRSTIRATEADHITEFDHDDPARGGPTTLENLHLLCRSHHRLKTARRIDPVRGPTSEPRRTTNNTDTTPDHPGDPVDPGEQTSTAPSLPPAPTWVPGATGRTLWSQSSRWAPADPITVPDGIDPATLLEARTLNLLAEDWREEEYWRHLDRVIDATDHRPSIEDHEIDHALHHPPHHDPDPDPLDPPHHEPIDPDTDEPDHHDVTRWDDDPPF